MKINLNTAISQTTIIFISLLYGFLNGSGFYGYNIDYHLEYYKENLSYPLIFDKLGIILSTLTINKFHVGVYLTSFIISFSAGIFINKCIKINFVNKFIKKNTYHYLFFLFIYLLTLHIHPLIMSTSGAMRQGWVMSFIFFSLTLFLNQKLFLGLIFSFIAIFMHKSGVIYFSYLLFTFISLGFLKKVKNYYNLIFLLFFFGITLTLVSSFFMYQLKIQNIFQAYDRVVYGDFRLFWLFFNLTYICIYCYFSKSNLFPLFDYPALFLYFSSWGNISFYILGYNDQFERLNMIIGVVYIFLSALILKKYFFMITFILIIFYLFLTIYQGMYSIGLY